VHVLNVMDSNYQKEEKEEDNKEDKEEKLNNN
jgi:hypothetical protein